MAGYRNPNQARERSVAALLSTAVIVGPLLALTLHWVVVSLPLAAAPAAVFEVASLASPPDAADLPPAPEQVAETRAQQRLATEQPVVIDPMVSIPHIATPLARPNEPPAEPAESLSHPAEAAAPPSQPAPPAQRATSDAANWEGTVLAHLQRFRRYPARARAAGRQGVVIIRFTMTREGRVLESAVAGSSGDAGLDRAALETLRRAQPLPTIPDERPERLTLTVPVEFSVR